MGLVRNCQDFWTRGRELGVRYEELYDVPVGGFRTRRDRERGEPGSISGGRVEGGSSQGAGGAQRRWSMWAGLKRGFEATPRRGGYELVSSMA